MKSKKDIYQIGLTPKQEKQILKNFNEYREYKQAYECPNCLTLQEHKDKCLKVKK